MTLAQSLAADDIASLERATLAAVAPEAVAEIPGWLLPFDSGTVGRAHSAVPLAHNASIQAADVAAIVARYRERGLAPSLRVADVPALAHLTPALMAAGLVRTQPTLTCVARVADMVAALKPAPDTGSGTGQISDADAGHVSDAAVRLLPVPDAAWRQVYLGEGFDPVDGASRVKALGRALGSMYACAMEPVGAAGKVVATGVGSIGHGWLGLHGMRTLPAYRGRGHASRILYALAQAAQAQGVARAYLQVEEANTGALRLYASFGFSVAWRYIYWRPGAPR
jgi:N-acetylglutamate synthase